MKWQDVRPRWSIIIFYPIESDRRKKSNNSVLQNELVSPRFSCTYPLSTLKRSFPPKGIPHVHPFLLPIVRNFVFRNLARLVGQICADWVDGGSIIDNELQ